MTTKKVKTVKEKTTKTQTLESLKYELFAPEDFLSTNKKVSCLSLDVLEKIYNLAKCSESSDSVDDPLGLQTASLKSSLSRPKKKKKRHALSKAEAPVPSLITENFDEDQIWEELELQNRFIYENLVTSVSKLVAFKDKSLQIESDSGGESVSEEEQNLLTENAALNVEENEQDDPNDSDFFESDAKYAKKSQSKNRYQKSVVDDKFFNLAQMTEYIERIEAEESDTKATRKTNEDDEDHASDEEIDLFEDVPSESDSDKETSEYYYKDFFDPPLGDGSQQPKHKKGQNDVGNVDEIQNDGDASDDDDNENLGEEGDDVSEEESVSEEDDDESRENPEKLKNKISETLSSFEKRKKKIEENIEEIENEALQPKSWHLLGETTGESRPENALLEEHLIYDHLIRPAPAITVETTMKLEDVIKQRIKDGAWDDVQRKVRPVEDPREYKKRLVLDAEKSKASLAEVYEKEYLDQKRLEEGETEEKEPEEHVKIRNDLKALFQKLDTLSHFHFTPKPPPPEVKIITNAPSISVEETAGVSISDANMLAPQEIQDHSKGAIIGKDERTDTDRKRERRKKKKKQHLKRLMHEEKARAKGLGLRNIKLADGIIKSQQKGAKHTDGYSTSNQSAKELKSSKAFFSKLQQKVTSHIDKVAKRKNSSSDNASGNVVSAKKYKM